MKKQNWVDALCIKEIELYNTMRLTVVQVHISLVESRLKHLQRERVKLDTQLTRLYKIERGEINESTSQ